MVHELHINKADKIRKKIPLITPQNLTLGEQGRSGDLSFQVASGIGQASEDGGLDKTNPTSYSSAHIITGFGNKNTSKKSTAFALGGFNTAYS